MWAIFYCVCVSVCEREFSLAFYCKCLRAMQTHEMWFVLAIFPVILKLSIYRDQGLASMARVCIIELKLLWQVKCFSILVGVHVHRLSVKLKCGFTFTARIHAKLPTQLQTDMVRFFWLVWLRRLCMLRAYEHFPVSSTTSTAWSYRSDDQQCSFNVRSIHSL